MPAGAVISASHLGDAASAWIQGPCAPFVSVLQPVDQELAMLIMLRSVPSVGPAAFDDAHHLGDLRIASEFAGSSPAPPRPRRLVGRNTLTPDPRPRSAPGGIRA